MHHVLLLHTRIQQNIYQFNVHIMHDTKLLLNCCFLLIFSFFSLWFEHFLSFLLLFYCFFVEFFFFSFISSFFDNLKLYALALKCWMLLSHRSIGFCISFTATNHTHFENSNFGQLSLPLSFTFLVNLISHYYASLSVLRILFRLICDRFSLEYLNRCRRITEHYLNQFSL